MYNKYMSILSGYTITGNGLRLYCKIIEYGINTDNYKCTMLFGTGMRKFCLTASYNKKNQYEIYIDRVEKQDICILDSRLSNVGDGTAKLVKIALWTMKQLYPHVKQYTFIDTSQIHCDGEHSKDTMHMGYDYILKYNKTWYQKKFKAELESEEYAEKLNKSLKALDEEIVPLDLIKDIFPDFIEKYKQEYESSNTPRDFINKLRKKHGKEYCNIVGQWLNRYMKYLRINIYPESWLIKEENIIKPTKFKATKLSPSDVTTRLNRISGGKRTRKQYKYCIMNNCIIGGSDIIGVYNDNDDY
jgi:hypothetical protein